MITLRLQTERHDKHCLMIHAVGKTDIKSFTECCHQIKINVISEVKGMSWCWNAEVKVSGCDAAH